MRSQPNRNYVSNDDIQTPLALARSIVTHFQPTGRILEPCRGDGNFLKAIRGYQRQAAKISGLNQSPVCAFSAQGAPGSVTHSLRSGHDLRPHHLRASRASSSFSPQVSKVLWTEIKRGRDFFDWDQPVDWIITNPPWSQIRDFLCHAMEMADHVVFLFTINHLWTKARLRDIDNADFGIREIALTDMPKTFPQSGFQLGAVHLQYNWKGKITMSELEEGRGRRRKSEGRKVGRSKVGRSKVGRLKGE